MAQVNMVRLNPELIELNGTVRVERGPKLKTAVATEELLADDVTATHYQPPKTETVDGEEVTTYSLDAVGNAIILGNEMTYLDWKGEYTWYVYQISNPEDPNSWVEVKTIDGSETEAVLAASALLN